LISLQLGCFNAPKVTPPSRPSPAPAVPAGWIPLLPFPLELFDLGTTFTGGVLFALRSDLMLTELLPRVGAVRGAALRWTVDDGGGGFVGVFAFARATGGFVPRFFAPVVQVVLA
jgi:hypothetical protein